MKKMTSSLRNLRKSRNQKRLSSLLKPKTDDVKPVEITLPVKANTRGSLTFFVIRIAQQKNDLNLDDENTALD